MCWNALRHSAGRPLTTTYQLRSASSRSPALDQVRSASVCLHSKRQCFITLSYLLLYLVYFVFGMSFVLSLWLFTFVSNKLPCNNDDDDDVLFSYHPTTLRSAKRSERSNRRDPLPLQGRKILIEFDRIWIPDSK